MITIPHPWLLVAWIIASWVIGMLGRDKRFGFFGNFLVAFLFSPVVGLLVLLASADRVDQDTLRRMRRNKREHARQQRERRRQEARLRDAKARQNKRAGTTAETSAGAGTERKDGGQPEAKAGV